ncbi:MAG TPA: hypothetical protein VKY92_18625 [Verrucomicrobiae bacterium]|nr:hypothetical protein [Verrucomicrobiae bacterium]
MNDTNPEIPSAWKRPLQGWLGWVIFALAGAVLSAIAWWVIGLVTEEPFETNTASRLLIAVGIGFAVAAALKFLAWSVCSWENFKHALLGCASVAGLVALFYAEEDIRGWLTWHQFKSHWEAKGEKFDFADFIPPVVPDEQNFAMAPVVASTYGRVLDHNGKAKQPQDESITNQLQMPLAIDDEGPRNGMGDWQRAIPSNLEGWQQYYRDLAETTNVFPVAAQAQSPGADVLLALSKYKTILEALREAAARPASRFPLNYEQEQTFAILLPHLAPLKQSAGVLRFRALAELQAGQAEEAMADIRLGLNLTEKIRSEPFLISHLVRIAMFQIIQQAIWEGLYERRWTDAQLAQLDRDLARFDFVADYVTAMRGENACDVSAINYLRHHANLLGSLGEFNNENRSRKVSDLGAFLMPSGWFYQNETRASRFILEEFLPVADVTHHTFSTEQVDQAGKSLAELPHTPYTLIARMLLPALTRSSHRFAFAQASLDLARCGCALERYRLATGNYPEELSLLAPRFLASVPVDPIGGQSLHYQSEPNGSFILYSVGWNGTDDGGHIASRKGAAVDLDKGDWVWRYPNSKKL